VHQDVSSYYNWGRRAGVKKLNPTIRGSSMLYLETRCDNNGNNESNYAQSYKSRIKFYFIHHSLPAS
jgi:hypothetical protein